MVAPEKKPTNEVHRLEFLQGFLKRPKEVGSIIPSSRFLMQRVVRSANADEAKLIVELGPGTGVVTRTILRSMQPDARLLAIEINPRFIELIGRTLRDERLHLHLGGAQDIEQVLQERGLPRPDVILSGIPFSTMDRELALSILRAVHAVLAPGGRFVAYQFRDRVEVLGREVFGQASVQTELLNVPPMRVYRWEKP